MVRKTNEPNAPALTAALNGHASLKQSLIDSEELRRREQAETIRQRRRADDLEFIVIELRHQLGAVTQQALHTNTAYQRRIDELLQERASREA